MGNTLKLGNGNWATKKDSLLAYNDENNNFKPLPFEFERASSATVVNKDGLIETVGNDIPRIDYSDDANGALLLEPQRTNLINYSEDFSGWFKSGAITVTSNYGVSPTGENNSTLLSFSGANNRLYLNTGAAYNNDSVSIYVKGNNGETISFDKSASIGGAKLFTLTGGWDRLESSYNSLSSSSVNIVISTNGGATAANIEVFGIQNEESSYATSYIPTQGSAVTRLADSCTNGGNEQVINSTEGVLYFEGSAFDVGSGNNKSITLSDATNSNSIVLITGIVANKITAISRVNGSEVSPRISGNITINVISKIAIRWGNGLISLWIDGIKIGEVTKSSAATANSLTFLQFQNITGAEPFYGNVKDLRVYNTALTDSELQKLTTI